MIKFSEKARENQYKIYVFTIIIRYKFLQRVKWIKNINIYIYFLFILLRR